MRCRSFALIELSASELFRMKASPTGRSIALLPFCKRERHCLSARPAHRTCSWPDWPSLARLNRAAYRPDSARSFLERRIADAMVEADPVDTIPASAGVAIA